MKDIVVTLLPQPSAVAEQCVAPALLAALHKAGQDTASTWQADDLAALEQRAGDASRYHIVIYDSAQCALETALGQETLDAQAPTRWQEQTGALLALFRRNRRNIVLVMAQAVAADPEAAWQALCPRLGLPADSAAPVLAAAPEAAPNWVGVLADYAVRQDPALAELIPELTASSAASAEPVFDIAAAHHEIAQLRATRRLKEHAAENDLLRMQLTEQRQEMRNLSREWRTSRNALQKSEKKLADMTAAHNSELAASRAALQKSEKKLADTTAAHKAELAASRAALQDSEKKLASTSAARSTLQSTVSRQKQTISAQKQTIATQKKTIQTQRKDHENLASELQAGRAELQVARDELQALWESTSWRVTTPLRYVKRSVSRDPKD